MLGNVRFHSFQETKQRRFVKLWIVLQGDHDIERHSPCIGGTVQSKATAPALSWGRTLF